MKITRQFKSLTMLAGVLAVLGAGALTPSAQAKGDKRDKEERKAQRNERKQERKYRKEQRKDRRDDRPNYGHSNPNYGYPNSGAVPSSRGYTGEVLNVVSSNRVDVRVNGRLYNVFLIGRLPRGLNRGDIVRVNGVRQNNNDIRQARLQIINNR